MHGIISQPPWTSSFACAVLVGARWVGAVVVVVCAAARRARARAWSCEILLGPHEKDSTLPAVPATISTKGRILRLLLGN